MKKNAPKSISTSEKDFTTLPLPNSLPSSSAEYSIPKKPPEVDKSGKRKEFGFAADIQAGRWRGVTSDQIVSSSREPLATKLPTASTKRALEGNTDANLYTPEIPPAKRLRPYLRSALNSDAFHVGFHTNNTTPISPLFFSHSQRGRPGQLLAFSNAQAAEIMLKTAREETNITTLKLARGNISSPPISVGSDGLRSTGGIGSPVTPDSETDSDSLKVVGGVGICELLELDERPSFLFDLANPANLSPGPLHLIFANQALRAHDGLYLMVKGKVHLESPGAVVTSNFPEFKAWALSFVENNEAIPDVTLPSFLFGGVRWDCKTLRKRIRLISGISSPHLSNIASKSSYDVASNPSLPNSSSKSHDQNENDSNFNVKSKPPADYFGDAIAKVSINPASMTVMPVKAVTKSTPATMTEKRPIVDKSISEIVNTIGTAPSLASECVVALQSSGFRDTTLTGVVLDNFFDWTRLPLTSALPKHVLFARSVDWSQTSLGPIENWDFSLRSISNLVFGSPHPAAMYWGPDHVAIYNEAYILIAGQKHPSLMGAKYEVAWAEIWDQISDVFKNAWESGQSTMKDDDCFFVKRNGFLEESYFTWSIIPLVGEDGNVVGLYNPAFEKTRRKIAERRMLTLREVGEKTAAAREVKEFWGQVIKGLAFNEYDVPFVFLYSVSEDDSDMSSMNSGSQMVAPQLVLEGTLGVPNGHPSAASPLDMKTSGEGFAPALREAIKLDKPILLTTENGTLSTNLIAGLEWRGFPEPSRAAVVCPIHPTTGDSIVGFLVMGINPRRPYDDDYSLFIQLLTRQLATGMASVVLFEEEIRRGQRAARLAALDRIELSKQLEMRTQEAVEAWKKRMEEAVELKRQQENFIDMTSHEMRNPLSAILQCADEISTTLSQSRSHDINPDLDDAMLSSIEAASTIALCAQHQKRIVDDILTLSKLDSALLAVTPVETQPHAVVNRALRMFEGEFETNDIQMDFDVEDSYKALSIEWVKLDPSRLLQVLINLTTNAIKFTHTEPTRKICVSIGASREKPTSKPETDVQYFPTRLERPDVTSGSDWGTGEKLFLTFSVKDTGRGLDENEKKLLFLRFSQTSVKTHYGGSGLGLFISRELTELQGGEIGVASERGVGSTFAFYIRCTRADKPNDADDIAVSQVGSELGRKSSKSVHSRQGIERGQYRQSPPLSASPSSRLTPPPLPHKLEPPKPIMKVLIVEDNLVNQRVLQKQLRNLGWITHLANHGGEALAVLEKSKFWKGVGEEGIEISVVLMDLEMPEMDGLTCARKIRELEKVGQIVRHVPIIAVTANARLEQIQKALDAGMDSVVSKPFRINELIPKIDDLMAIAAKDEEETKAKVDVIEKHQDEREAEKA